MFRNEEEAYLERSDNEQDGDGAAKQKERLKVWQAAAFGEDPTTADARSGSNNSCDQQPSGDQADSLDKYMAELEQSLKEEESQRHQDRGERLDDDDTVADTMEAIAEYHEAKRGVAEVEDDDEEDAARRRGNRVLLPPVDHTQIAYQPFTKDIYQEHPSITALPVAERAQFRAEKKITVTGYKVPHAIDSFDMLKQTVQKALIGNIAAEGWVVPTPVQSQLIPAALAGRDVVATAETGSGKTAAYLIPLIQHVCKVLDAWKLVTLPAHRGPVGLILCPTRELAAQIYGVTKQLATGLRLRVSCFSGGYEKTQQFKEIVAGIEICIANPGRFIDLATMKGGVTLQDVTLFVLDEVDRMLSMGFYPEVHSISNATRPDKQVLMLSATLPPEVRSLVQSITSRPVHVTIGTESQAASTVEQRPIVFPDEQRKADWILSNIAKLVRWDRQVLVFCRSHGRTLDLSAVLNSVLQEAAVQQTDDEQKGPDNADLPWDPDDTGGSGSEGTTAAATTAPAAARLVADVSDTVSSRVDQPLGQGVPTTDRGSPQKSEPTTRGGVGVVASAAPVLNTQSTAAAAVASERIYARHLFGDMNQAQRQGVVRNFRKKRFPVLVASDVAARGLDIPNVSTVVSYDAALQFDTHIHRIGRTGRAGARGIAYTLLTRKDAKLAGFVVETMQKAAQPVPKQVMQLAMTFGPFRTAQQSGLSYLESMRSKKKGGRLGHGGGKHEASRPGSISAPGLGGGSQLGATAMFAPTVDKRSREEHGRAADSSGGAAETKRSRFASLTQGSTSLGGGTTTTSATGFKVFNPTDAISSSDDEDRQSNRLPPPRQQPSCLLKPRRPPAPAAATTAAVAAAVDTRAAAAPPRRSRWE